MAHNGKTSAELEGEVEAQRQRLSARVSEIQERLSPGQLIDEFLDYARNSGGRDFVANLGRNVQSNPLPVALTGIGLAWLVASNAMPADNHLSERASDRELDRDGRLDVETYPYARITGSALTRVGQATDDAGRRYTEFADDAGARFRAMSDELGNRAGHFTDEAGAMYGGFTDEAGNRIRSFLDEAGNRLDDAQGWASDAWEGAQERLAGLRDGANAAADSLRHRAAQAGGQLQHGTGDLGRTLSNALRDQPLIGAALAFAVGAALGAGMPPTPQEDAAMGKAADDMKAQGARAARKAYEEGKEQVSSAYEAGKDAAAAEYGRMREDIGNGASSVTH